MKRLRILAAALAALCLLSGCGLLRNSHVSVEEHKDPYAYKEEETETESTTEPEETALQVASNYYAIMSILRAFVSGGVEHGSFLLSNYRGNMEEELPAAFWAMKNEEPLGAYAVDYMEYERVQQGEDWLVTVDTVYRRSTSEISAIQSVRGNERAFGLIRDTVEQLGTAVTLQISGYQEQDFAAEVRRYCLENPNVIVQMPEISLDIYPDTGNVRIVELHLSYGTDRETLRGMQTEAQAVLTSAENYARYAQDERTKLSLIYSYLTSRFPYTEDAATGSPYSLLCQGTGNSESFAATTNYLLQKIGVSCILVEGTRPGETLSDDGQLSDERYLWNIVWIDGICYHVDLQADALAGEPEPRLWLDGDMKGYVWDREAYPACDGEVQTQELPEET